MSVRTRIAALVIAAPVVLAFSACSLLMPTLTEQQLEDEIRNTLKTQASIEAETVDCPGSLKGEVGAMTECTITADGAETKVKVTVTSVENRTIKFDIDEA